MAPHSSTLAWTIPGTGEPGGLPSMGSHRVGHDWSDLAAAAAAAGNIPTVLRNIHCLLFILSLPEFPAIFSMCVGNCFSLGPTKAIITMSIASSNLHSSGERQMMHTHVCTCTHTHTSNMQDDFKEWWMLWRKSKEQCHREWSWANVRFQEDDWLEIEI